MRLPRLPRHPALEGYAPRREPSRRLGSLPARAFGPLCRPEVGVPSRPRDSSLSAIRGFAPLRGAVPTGGRRSKPSPRFFAVGNTWFRPAMRGGADRRSAFQAVSAILRYQRRGFAPRYRGFRRESERHYRPRRGARCRPEVGVPLPVARESEQPLTARGAARRCADRRSAFPCLHPVSERRRAERAPKNDLAANSLPARSGESVKGGNPPFHKKVTTHGTPAARRRRAREFRWPARSAGRFKRGAQLLSLSRVTAFPVLRPPLEPLDGVDEGTRTPNHRNHNPVLCH